MFPLEVGIPRKLGAKWWQKGSSAQMVQEDKKSPQCFQIACVFDFLSTITLKMQCYTRLRKDESIF